MLITDATLADGRRRDVLIEDGTITAVEPSIAGDADVDAVEPIAGDRLHAKCGWTPFEGWDGVFPELTLVGGEIAYENGRFGDVVGENVRT